MILYQLAKRLEQRRQLQHSIEQSTGDNGHLVSQKEQVEDQLMTQASLWSEAGNDEFMLTAIQPEIDAAEYTSTWS